MATPNLLKPFDQNNPFMPPMPPPSSAGAGFQIWAAEPQNAMKVQPSMTSPSAPLQPNAGMASANPPGVQAPLTPPAQPPIAAQPNSPAQPQIPTQEQDMAANPGEYQRPTVRGTGSAIANMLVAGLAGAAGGLNNRDPLAGVRYAQGVQEHDAGIPDANAAIYQNRVVKPQKDKLAMADTQAQIDQRKAAGDKSTAAADSYAPIKLSPEQAVAIGHPELAGQDMPSKLYATMLSGKQKTDAAAGIQGTKNQTAKEIAEARNARIKENTEASNKTKLLLQDKKSATSAANTNARIAAKGAGAPGAGKVPADVTKRAALSSNVLENSDAIDGILNRRPDIVGASGGRYSNIQQLIGSDDPDIQALGVRMHNIALASNGAHGLRSAEAIAQTENELFNHFKAGPNAIRGGLGAIRGSVQTFLDDEKNYQTSGSRTGNPMKPPTGAAVESYVRDPKTGKLVKQ